MKLTNAMREEFVADVIGATKFKSKWDKEKVVEEIDKRLYATVPEEIKAFDKAYPNMLQTMSFNLPFMLHKVKSGKSIYYDYANASCIKCATLHSIDITDLEAEWAKYRAECDARDEMRARLLEIAREMTTDEQLAAALPKLVKFIPKPLVKIKAGLPVPMKGIQDELLKMGLAAK